MKQTRIIDLVFSVAFAIGIWCYVISVVNPPQTVLIRQVPVQLQGLDSLKGSGYTIADSGEYSVDVEVKGPRSQVNAITENDIAASISLAGLTTGPNYVNVKVSAPDGLSIEKISTPKIPVNVDELITEVKPAVIYYPTRDDGFEVTIIMMEVENVRITGARTLVETVDQVRYDLNTDELLKDISTTQRIPGIVLDADGQIVENLKLSNSQLYVTAALYQTKDVPLNVSYEGTPGLGAQLSSVVYPRTLKLKARSSLMKNIDSIDAEIINIEGITSDLTVPLVYDLPDSVYLADDTKEPEAVFKLVHQGEISFTYDPSDISVKSVPAECEGYHLEKRAVTVTAKGDLSIIRKLEAKDLQPFVDLSTIENGENEIRLQSDFVNENVSISIQPEFINVDAKMPVPEPDPDDPDDPENPDGPNGPEDPDDPEGPDDPEKTPSEESSGKEGSSLKKE
ncbi:MAG: hypothetical protein HUJ80_01480 [Firmicutes bacterium]|nr:hypothetical protein [Bacillota bacterium]